MEVPPRNPQNATPSPPSLGAFFLTWLGFGIQSFGGGSVTLALIRRGAVEKQQWVTEAEFTRDWALVQMAPGINLVGFTILLARRVHGATGIVLALLGLLLPSALATILLTALYAHYAGNPTVHAITRGLLPATVGVGLITSAKMALPPLTDARREGTSSINIAIQVLAGSAFAVAAFPHLPVVAVFVGGATICALARWYQSHRLSTGQGGVKSVLDAMTRWYHSNRSKGHGG